MLTFVLAIPAIMWLGQPANPAETEGGRMISPRYAAPVAALLALALVPTVIHSYRGVRVTDERRTAAIAGKLDGMSSTPTARRPTWVQEHFDSDDWIERTYERDRSPRHAVRRPFVRRQAPLPSPGARAPARHARRPRVARPTPRARPDVPLHLIELAAGRPPRPRGLRAPVRRRVHRQPGAVSAPRLRQPAGQRPQAR